jgi:hypothetical protein
MTSLNLSQDKLGVEGAKHLAAGIRVNKRVVAVVLVPFACPSDLWLNCCCLLLSTKDMRALSTFTFRGNYIDSKPVTIETAMTEADFSGKALGGSGGMMVAAFLPKCQ